MGSNIENTEKIICPYCGGEYLPVEIYIPNEFFGTPDYIERDEKTHKLIKIYGSKGNSDETYTCDFCNRKFLIKSKTIYNTEKAENDVIDFEDEVITKISRPTKYELNEE